MAPAHGNPVHTGCAKAHSAPLALELEGLTKGFETAEGPVAVLRGVSFNLAPGQSLALTGESGSGKSTLLNIAAGLSARMPAGFACPVRILHAPRMRVRRRCGAGRWG